MPYTRLKIRTHPVYYFREEIANNREHWAVNEKETTVKSHNQNRLGDTLPIMRNRAKTTEKLSGSKMGQHNHASTELDILLDIVEKHEPLRHNLWTVAYYEYRDWARSNNYTERDCDTFKHKFDKKTGDPSCPPHIHRAKKTARNIAG